MCNDNSAVVNKPYMVDDLVVYLTSPESANVIETDCRIELTTTLRSCTCCTFRFNSWKNPDFRCRHIKALHRVLNLE